VPDATLILFAKAPVPGQVKTRLIPALGAARAALLHMALVRRAIETAKGSGIRQVDLCCAPVAHPFLMACRDRYGLSLSAQEGPELGDRMAAALARALERRPLAVLIGSDCPGLTPGDLYSAARHLDQGYDAVLGPAADGGYVLIGLKRVDPGLFTGIPWGTRRVADLTRQRLRALGWRWWELPVRSDIDRPADLPGLPADLWPVGR
jgi:rSAM/selenodomain-associated transferase 1